MPQYFCHFGDFNVPKNKLQSAVIDLFKAKSGFLYPSTEAFITEISIAIKQIHLTFPRCKPIEINNWGIDQGHAFGCGSEWTCQIYLYIIKE